MNFHQKRNSDLACIETGFAKYTYTAVEKISHVKGNNYIPLTTYQY